MNALSSHSFHTLFPKLNAILNFYFNLICYIDTDFLWSQNAKTKGQKGVNTATERIGKRLDGHLKKKIGNHYHGCQFVPNELPIIIKFIW